MVVKISETQCVESLFRNWEETIIWSCLQDIMGSVYADDCRKPQSAMAVLGDFCFFAGRPNIDLVRYKPETCRSDFMIMVPQNDGWNEVIEMIYGEKAKLIIRYAIKKEEHVFDKKNLEKLSALTDSSYTMHRIDETMFNLCCSESWSQDLVSQFCDYQSYQALGLGVVLLKNGELVCGASSYSRYQNGIEVEIDTKPAYRRQGLATACGARLILECLSCGLYPSWDAQNRWSVALAEKLGYHFDHEYKAYEIWGY